MVEGVPGGDTGWWRAGGIVRGRGGAGEDRGVGKPAVIVVVGGAARRDGDGDR